MSSELTIETICKTATRGQSLVRTCWGKHQPIFARHGHRLYALVLSAQNGHQHWALFARTEQGWEAGATGPTAVHQNQPGVLLVTTDGTLHIFAWPDGQFTHFVSNEAGNFREFNRNPIPTEERTTHPYMGGCTNERGDILLVTSPPGRHDFYLLRAGETNFEPGVVATFPTSRFAYPYVCFHGETAHILTVEDIYDARKRGDFKYAYRKLHFYTTAHIGREPFQRVILRELEEIESHIEPNDLMIDRDGIAHVLYAQTPDAGRTPPTLVHAVAQPGEPFEETIIDAPGADVGRMWQAPDGRLHLILHKWYGKTSYHAIWRPGEPPAYSIEPLALPELDRIFTATAPMGNTVDLFFTGNYPEENHCCYYAALIVGNCSGFARVNAD